MSIEVTREFAETLSLVVIGVALAIMPWFIAITSWEAAEKNGVLSPFQRHAYIGMWFASFLAASGAIYIVESRFSEPWNWIFCFALMACAFISVFPLLGALRLGSEETRQSS